MFTWICPKCGREVPPAYNDCPDCTAREKDGAPAQQADAPGGDAAPPLAAAPPAATPRGTAPPPPVAMHAPRPSGAIPTWLLSVLFAFAFVGLGAGVYWLVGALRGGGQNEPQTRQSAPLENPAAKGPARPHPLQKYIEVSGVRFIQDAKKKTEVRFLVVNHSPDDIGDLGGIVTILGRTQKSGEETVGTFTFKLPSVGPWESKELSAPVETKLRVYELPDWQNVSTEVQITSP